MLDLTTDDIPEQRDQELLKIIQPLGDDQLNLSETELVQQLGMAGMFWAALHKFTRTPSVPCSDIGSDIGSDIDMSSDADEPMEADDDMGLPTTTWAYHPPIPTPLDPGASVSRPSGKAMLPAIRCRSRAARHTAHNRVTQAPGWAISPQPSIPERMRLCSWRRHFCVTPSSTQRRSSSTISTMTPRSCYSNMKAFAGAFGPRWPAAPLSSSPFLMARSIYYIILGTVLRSLRVCSHVWSPYWNVRSVLGASWMESLPLPTPFLARSQLKHWPGVSLRFRPCLVQSLVPQAPSSPLILLHFLTTYISTIVVILAVRQYICFLSFHISEAYIGRLQSPDNLSSGDDEYKLNEDWDTISVNATAWHDLGSEEGRLLACSPAKISRC